MLRLVLIALLLAQPAFAQSRVGTTIGLTQLCYTLESAQSTVERLAEGEDFLLDSPCRGFPGPVQAGVLELAGVHRGFMIWRVFNIAHPLEQGFVWEKLGEKT